MTATRGPIRVGVVGDDTLAARIDRPGDEQGVPTVASTVPAATPADRLADLDCLLVGTGLETASWQSVIERVSERHPLLPVVALVDGDEEVAAAIEAGVTEYVPQSLVETHPQVVGDRLADVATWGPESARQFRHVTENVDEIIFVTNADFSAVEYVNSAYEEIWDRPVEELNGDATAFIEGIDPRDRERFEAEFEAMREQIRGDSAAESYEFEFRVRRTEDDVRWVQASVYPVEVPGGADRLVGIAEDVTDRRELERTHRELFESVSDGLVVHAPEDGVIVDVNERFCELTGYDRSELVGETVELVTAPDEEYPYDRAKELINSARDEGPQLFEWREQRKDGEILPVEVHLRLATLRGEERVLASVRDISDRKTTETRLQTILERIDAGVMLVPEGETEPAYLNPVYEELTGIPVEELYDSERFVERIHPEDREGYVADVGAMIEDIQAGDTRDSYEFEFRFRRPDGETRWFHWTGYPLVAEDNDYWYVGVTTDVTDRRERQRRLAAERDRRSILFENSPDPIMAVEFVDGAPYITEVNSPFESVFGIGADDATDRPIDDVIVPETEREGYERIRRQALAGEPVEAEVRRETTDGVRDFLLRVLPFESNSGREAYVWFTDITERKRREREIEEEREKYSTLVEQSTDGVAVVSDGEYVFVNEQFVEMTGYDESDLRSMPFQEVFAPEYRELVTERYRRRVEGESPPNQYDLVVETPEGDQVTLATSVSRIRHEGEPATLANFRDVTQRRERERAVERLQDATEQLQGAETTEAVYDITVRTARDVLGLPMTATWRHDPKERRLEYVTGTEPVEEMPTGPVPFTPGDRAYELFEAGTATTYDPSRYHDHTPLSSSIVVPLGEAGLLAAGDPDRDGYESYLVDLTRVLAGHATTALERVRRSMELRESQRRLEAIVDRIDEAIFLAPVSELTDPQPAPEFVSSGYEDIWGQSLEALQLTHEKGFFDTLHPGDSEEYRSFVEGFVADVEAGEADERYSIEYRIERRDGAVRWVHSDLYPTAWTDGVPRVVIASRDVTERKERERTLESFHDATAELTTAETVADASATAAEAAADVLGLPGTAVYRYDEGTADLEPAATGPAAPEPAELAPLSAEDTAVWEVFVDERMARVELGSDQSPAIGADKALVFPLGGNGVLLVWRSGEAVDTEAASILAATLEAALNRLRGERQLESRRRELAEQTERASRLETITELTRNVESAITTQSSRRGIQEAVCSELAELEPFAAAWIAAAEVGTDRLTPRAVAGTAREHAERALGGGPDGSDPHPAVEAWQTGQPRVVADLVGGGRRTEWRQQLLRTGAGSVCAVPLSYNGITYGVLTVVAEEPSTFGNRERDVLAQLGTSIGYAIAAIERQRALESDDTLELEFHGEGMALPLAKLARRADCTVRHERTIRRQDGSVSVYYSLDGEVPESVGETAAATLPGEVEVVTAGEDGAVVERTGSSWFGALLSEYGGVLRHGRATGGGVELVVELPQETDTRTIVERLQAEFPGLELTAQRQHRETEATPSEVRDRLHERLSPRQQEALETAHAMGYFEWPRESSGEAVADRLGITQPTVNKHIRIGESKVFDLLFGAGSDP